jgi:glycosyltransferase involved in cell wall biosynthesis
LAFTSLRDASSATVLQSLSLGVPIVCFRISGFGDIVDSSCGIPIAVTNPRQAVCDFRTAIHNIINHPECIERLSAGALNAARTYSWDHLADQIRLAWYSALGLSRSDSNPSEEIQSEITELQPLS